MDVLSHARYFRDLDRDEIAAIDDRMVVRGYADGEAIYHSGSLADGLFILATGKVKLVRPSLDGADVLVDVITPGSAFGSASTAGEPTYSDTASALTVSCALWISTAEFGRVLREHPSVALAVLEDVGERLEQAQQAVRVLSGGTVEQRIAATLLTLTDKVGTPRGDATLLQLPLTRTDLAAMTGTTTESVSRVLSRLRRAGVVETGRRWTAVTDRAALARLSEG